jgi:hypothetical protein
VDDLAERPADAEPPRHIGLAEIQVGIDGEPEERAAIAHEEIADDAVGCSVGAAAVPQLQSHGTVGDGALHLRGEPAIHRRDLP